MKIISQGTKPEAKKLVWVGKVVECRYCQFKGEMEEGDAVFDFRETSNRDIFTAHGLGVKCPTCGTTITVLGGLERFHEQMDKYLKGGNQAISRPQRPFYPPPHYHDTTYTEPLVDPSIRPFRGAWVTDAPKPPMSKHEP